MKWFISIIERLIMPKAADIVRVVLDHGKLKPPDIMIQLSVYEPKSTYLDSITPKISS